MIRDLPGALPAALLSAACLIGAAQTAAQPAEDSARAAQTVAADPLAEDTPLSTVAGNTFIAPAGWTVTVRGPATILEAPEGGSWLALIDVDAKSHDAALAAGWAAYKDNDRPLKVTNDLPDENGWSKIRRYEYHTSPNERRSVIARVFEAAEGSWTVLIYDMADDVGEKRGSQVTLVLDRLFAKGYSPESFAGREALPLDAARIGQLTRFVEDALEVTRVPGASLGVIQNGEVVFAGGFGVRELGKPEKPDANTLYMVASNTKGLTTLLLAKLVEAGKMSWDTPVTELLPSFRVGNAETTRQVRVEHLICACTGMPRQDMEWIFEFGDLSPADAMTVLATMQPTSDFGDLFQYSNMLAGAAGFVAGHVLHPDLELGTAYDKAIQEIVFEPLGMTATTFDFERALDGDNWANAHAPDIDGEPALAVFDVNYSVLPVRPAGAAWSTVSDMLRYVAMELAEGTLPNGERYIAREPLLERRTAQVAVGKDEAYGMGLLVDNAYGVTAIHHGGDMIGYHSDMIWLPEHGVGAVVLTNGDPGWFIRTRFRRKLLEVLFDGRPQADEALAADSRRYYEQLTAERKLLDVPADAAEAAKLAPRYRNDALGEIAITRELAGATRFDFGEWQSEVASRVNPDGTVSFLTIAPGISGFEFVVGAGSERALTLRDAQHEYVFREE